MHAWTLTLLLADSAVTRRVFSNVISGRVALRAASAAASRMIISSRDLRSSRERFIVTALTQSSAVAATSVGPMRALRAEAEVVHAAKDVLANEEAARTAPPIVARTVVASGRLESTAEASVVTAVWAAEAATSAACEAAVTQVAAASEAVVVARAPIALAFSPASTTTGALPTLLSVVHAATDAAVAVFSAASAVSWRGV